MKINLFYGTIFPAEQHFCYHLHQLCLHQPILCCMAVFFAITVYPATFAYS